MYLFGSHLIKKYFPDFRIPFDIDWVTNDLGLYNSKISSSKEEYHYIPFSPNREMIPDELYTIKFSHAIYDIKWQKTMSDIRFLQIKGCRIIPKFLIELRKYWEKVHGEQKRTDFTLDQNIFFNDKVKRKIDHDDLHKMINPIPTYTKIVDGVNPDPDRFFKLSDNDKREIPFEEAFVISLERFNNYPNKKAYHLAQNALVTRLHPIWVADFIIENWNRWYWNCSNSNFFNNYNNLKLEINEN